VLKKQILNFISVGIINTLVGYGLYAVFIFLGLHYTTAVLFATVLGVLFNFKTIGKFVFHKNDNRLIFKFVGVYAVVFCVNIIVIKVLLWYGMDEYIAGFCAIIPSAVVSFVLNKWFVYR